MQRSWQFQIWLLKCVLQIYWTSLSPVGAVHYPFTATKAGHTKVESLKNCAIWWRSGRAALASETLEGMGSWNASTEHFCAWSKKVRKSPGSATITNLPLWKTEAMGPTSRLFGRSIPSTNEATKLTHNLLTMGREVRLPAELVFRSTGSYRDEEVTSYGEYVDVLRSRMQHAHEIARKHLNSAAKRSKEIYDTKSLVNK